VALGTCTPMVCVTTTTASLVVAVPTAPMSQVMRQHHERHSSATGECTGATGGVAARPLS